MRTTVLIVAAGSGSRLQAGVPKALAPLADGRTLLEHCLESVSAAATDPLDLDAVVVVVPARNQAADALRHVCGLVAERTGLTIRCVPGGAERSDSVRAGLAAIRHPDTQPGRHAVLVHDAARPFVPPAVFHAVVTALEEGAAAVVPAVPVVDTVKTVEPRAGGSDGAAGPERVSGTLDRSGLRAVQTPQGFDLAALEEAHRRAAAAGHHRAAALTDDAMAMEAAGHPVVLVPGDPLSFKVTTPLDLLLANALLGPPARAVPPEHSAHPEHPVHPESLEDHP